MCHCHLAQNLAVVSRVYYPILVKKVDVQRVITIEKTISITLLAVSRNSALAVSNVDAGSAIIAV